ncbi:MAG: AAA-like domain-containing protein [Myxococcaceae bacterium]|nr:AAA-like domain-containing protein [Myxococcaceae bacterium]
MRFFNTAGPIVPSDHYFVPGRSHESEIRSLIEQKKYFVLHAPRQTGKTSGILSLTDKINQEGQYTALYVNVEPAQAMRNHVKDAIRMIVDQIRLGLLAYFPNDPVLSYFDSARKYEDSTGNELGAFLQFWASQRPKPILLFIDEIDSLVGDSLIAVLRQLRAGYSQRPRLFPSSVCLIGVRDIRDYPIWSEATQAVIQGGSAFNISAKSLFLDTFHFEQVADLYAQHTRETGQVFEEDAVRYAFEQTGGQPWLINAMAYQACFDDIKDRTQPITKAVFERAKEVLIARRDTHLDVLIDRLREPRIHRVISAILLGDPVFDLPQDDLSYSIDLGLIKRDENKNLVIANPIYQEIIPRELTHAIQASMVQQTAWYLNSDGTLNMQKLLEAFVQFYRENSEMLVPNMGYKEAGPHLLLMAFLQRVINGGGKIHREYALGRKRVDLLVEFKHQRFVIETKIDYGPKTLVDGLEQTADYMDKNNSTQGHLLLFDTKSQKTWDEKIYQKAHSVGLRSIQVWGL